MAADVGSRSPWGDGLDYSMRLHWFEDMDEDENRPYDMEEPNFRSVHSLRSLYAEVVQADRLYQLRRRWRMQYLRRAGSISRFPALFRPTVSPEVQEDK